jgi:serine/arginine repetitive matrix protein 2
MTRIIQVSASSLLFLVPFGNKSCLARYRVGMVESVTTPPIMSSERRLSLTVQTALAQGSTGEQVLLSPSHPPLRSPTDSRHSHTRRQILSSLQTPTTEATRSSYMTTASDLSRMSGLSAFPAPPKDQSTLSPNISLLSTYFNNDTTVMSSDPNPSGLPGSSAASLVQEERLTFGRNQNADDLAKTLSSPPRFDPPVPF